jgi:hypothetical protein
LENVLVTQLAVAVDEDGNLIELVELDYEQITLSAGGSGEVLPRSRAPPSLLLTARRQIWGGPAAREPDAYPHPDLPSVSSETIFGLN